MCETSRNSQLWRLQCLDLKNSSRFACRFEILCNFAIDFQNYQIVETNRDSAYSIIISELTQTIMSNNKNVFQIIIAAFCLSFVSCEQITRNSHEEYVELSTKTFYSLEDALSKTQSYLNFFSKKKVCNHCEDVKNIRNEFYDMKKFFDENRNLKQLYRDSKTVYFNNSSYESVRNTWKLLYNGRKNLCLENMMNQITQSTFRSYLKDYAESMCLEEWGGALIPGWQVSYSEENELGQPERLDDVYGKKCYGIYTVHMEGGLGLGLRRGSARVKVEGTVFITTDGDLDFKRVCFTILQTNGDLHRK